MSGKHDADITQLLARWKDGDERAFEDLLPLVYDDLRAVASKYIGRERNDHTWQATDLVHEAYLRLAKVSHLDTRDRAHFFTVAARAMRRILVDHARRHKSDKRTGSKHRVELDDQAMLRTETPEEILQLHNALTELEQRMPRCAQLVELRFFGGLAEAEASDVLQISRATATRDWRFAKLWLFKFLKAENKPH